MMSKYKLRAAKTCSSTLIEYLCSPPSISCVSKTTKKHINPAPRLAYNVRVTVVCGKSGMKIKNTVQIMMNDSSIPLNNVKSYFV